MTTGEQIQQEMNTGIESPLPLTYQRTNDPDEAEFTVYRVPFFGKKNPRSDQELIEEVRLKKESEQWYTDREWLDKGSPSEQITLTTSTATLTIYNFADKTLTEEHLDEISEVFGDLISRFPTQADKIKWLLINDEQRPSAYGDPDNYPTNGEVFRKWKAFQLYPRGIHKIPFRLDFVSNLKGVLTHELTHLIEDLFVSEWLEQFQWHDCADYPDDWEVRLTPDGTKSRYFNKSNGQMAPLGKFPVHPEKCVSKYAQMHPKEDLAESMVAYIYQPDLLKRIAPDKYEILRKHDALLLKPDVRTERVPKDQIQLPRVEPQDVLFYVEENNES